MQGMVCLGLMTAQASGAQMQGSAAFGLTLIEMAFPFLRKAWLWLCKGDPVERAWGNP